MCKRLAGERLQDDEKGLEGLIDDISEDHAKLVLDRLELLSKLREVAKNPKLDERINKCENNLDTPDWWEPRKHDRELIRAVLKYGLYRSDQYILNDHDFPFAEAEKRWLRSLEALKAIKMETSAEMLKMAREKSVEKSMEVEEKPEIPEEVVATPDIQLSTDIEKKPSSPKPADLTEPEILKSDEPLVEIPEVQEKTEKESEKVESEALEPIVEVVPETESIPASESESIIEKEIFTEIVAPVEATVDENAIPAIIPETEEPVKETVADESEKMEVDEPKIEETPEVAEPKPETVLEAPLSLEAPATTDETPKEEIPAVETMTVESETKETPATIEEEKATEVLTPEKAKIDTVVIEDDEPTAKDSQQTADLKARFPDLEVFQPLMKLKQFDSFLMKGGDTKDSLKSLSKVFDTSIVVKWFRDFALEKRISHIIYCVEEGVWPVGKNYSAYTGCLGIDLDLPLYETVKRIVNVESESKRSASSTPDIITITTDHHQMSKPMNSQLSAQLSAQLASQLHQSLSSNAALSISKNKKANKRHIAIDVETERAKLHALLNSTQSPLSQQKSNWNDDESNESRRSSASSGAALQPPPAHQYQPPGRTSNAASNYHKATVIPGTSSTLTPIDLSSR